MVEFVADYLGWVVAIVGAVSTFLVVIRKGGKRLRTATAKANQVSDVLLGRPAILHPETGVELAPETPGIGTRMAHIEQWQSDAGSILSTLAETQQEMVRTNARVDLLHDKLNRHIDGGPCPSGGCSGPGVSVTVGGN